LLLPFLDDCEERNPKGGGGNAFLVLKAMSLFFPWAKLHATGEKMFWALAM
jgi:hypothetical protein